MSHFLADDFVLFLKLHIHAFLRILCNVVVVILRLLSVVRLK